MNKAIIACSGGQALQVQLFKIQPHTVYLEREPYICREAGKMDHSQL